MSRYLKLKSAVRSGYFTISSPIMKKIKRAATWILSRKDRISISGRREEKRIMATTFTTNFTLK
jgi:hypothetical protein